MRDRSTVSGWIVGLTVVLLGTGAGAAPLSVFSAGIASPLSGGPGDALPILVLADVGSWTGPRDGELDLITADQSAQSGSGTVGVATVWYGDGTGAFKNSNGGIPLGRIPTALALGDFDHDGNPDLVITDTAGNLVFLHGVNDYPTFGTPGPPVPAGSGPVAVAAVDVNHDNNLDAVVVDATPSKAAVTVLLGDGHGGFTAGPTVDLMAGAASIATGDFNADGNIDLAIPVTNSSTNAVIILRGDGAGNFTALPPLSEDPNGHEPIAIGVGDVNNDGQPDLVVANHGSDNIAVFLGQGNFNFQAPGFFVSGTANSAPNGLVLFDANGDGKLDVGVSNNFSFDVSVLLGNGSGNYGTPRSFVTDQEPLTVAAGDLDGDGTADLVAINRDDLTSDVVTLLGHGDGAFSGPEDVIVQPTPSGAIAGDVDNDGLPDLIVAHPSGVLLVRRALATGGFAAPTTLQSAGDAVALGQADINLDGRLDVLALNQSTSNVSVFLGQDSGLPTTPQNYTVGAGALSLAVADWNGDGRPDIAVARQGSGAAGAIDILLSNADGSLQTPLTTVLSANPIAIDSGDFNNDGIPDLAMIFSVLSVTVAPAAAGSTTLTIVGAVPAGFPTSGTITSINGTKVTIPFTRSGATLTLSSGIPSALASNAALTATGAGGVGNATKLGILVGQGDGSFQAPVEVAIPASTNDAKALAVADFDGDGFDDVAVLLAPTGNQVVVLYGSGHVAFTAGAFPVHAKSIPWALAARDIDGDPLHLPDLLIADQQANVVSPFISQGAARRFIAAANVPVSRGPVSMVAADFDGDGRYDAAAADSFVAGSVTVLTNIAATALIRGDGNGDGKVSAADLIAVARKLADATITPVEQVGRGAHPAAQGADANGDGAVTAQDTVAVTHRLFPRL